MVEKKWIVSARQRCDLELLLVGGFSPLSGFLSQANYESVLANSRLESGALWPIPITLDVNEAFAEQISLGEALVLCDSDGSPLASMLITDKWQPDKRAEVLAVFGSESSIHPGVAYTLNHTGSWYLGGPVTPIQLPKHYDFKELRHSPQSLQEHFRRSGCQKIVAFQTRNPIHRAHMELTLRAAAELDAHLLLHPVVGQTMAGDIDYFTRVRCYQKISPYYPKGRMSLSLLPLAMRMAGPKEALWHALIRKNYGATHFIIGRDHAGPGKDATGQNFYPEYAAQELVREHQQEMGIEGVYFSEMVYVKERQIYCQQHEIKAQETVLSISGTALRQALAQQSPIPSWFSFPEIMAELAQAYPAKHQQGFTVFFTGLSGAGKSTLANALNARLMSMGKRRITMLDGDLVRQVLTSELGFSKEDRNLNIRRIAYVASELTKAGAIVLCAAIAPYRAVREESRQLIKAQGGYIEVYLSTSLATCEARDSKGLYAKARQGLIKNFTGIDDPYEPPLNAELVLDTQQCSIEMAVDELINYLINAGYLLKDELQSAADLRDVKELECESLI